MCGIAGYVERHDGARPDVVDAQLRTLVHRGPDAMGSFVRGRGAVGQTRLSIIDLETGDPPITDESGRIGVALNGEIYNFAALREELTRRGHTFSTRGDTEAIAHLAEDLGPVDLARRLHGMFAFAVWDERRDVLVLGRDRVGKKPLYYWAGPTAFVFGSEIKAVLEHPAVNAEVDLSQLPTYLTFGYVPTPQTFFHGIVSVPPGHVVTVDKKMAVSVEPYWVPEASGMGSTTRLELSLDDAAARLMRTLDRAVERRLVADVPIGAFLSGGVDSTAVVAAMSRLATGRVRTFTIGFEDSDGYDERRLARLTADRLGTEHTEFVVEPHAVDLIEKLVWHHDQPFGDSSAIPTYLLSELTRSQVTVALSGDGGDEAFAGYERFAAGVATGALCRAPSLVRTAATAALVRLPGGRAAKVRRFAARAADGLPDGFRSLVEYVPSPIVRDLCGGGDPWGLDDYRSTWTSSAGAATLDRLLVLNLRTYLLDDLLPKVDRMSMAHGLEVRCPFLDQELVELALRLPPPTKARGLSLKRALRHGLRGTVPDEVLAAPKRGFGVPLGRWFRDDLAAYLHGMLGAGARVRNHVAAEPLDRLLRQHAAGTDHGHALWTLLTLEVFLRRHDG